MGAVQRRRCSRLSRLWFWSKMVGAAFVASKLVQENAWTAMMTSQPKSNTRRARWRAGARRTQNVAREGASRSFRGEISSSIAEATRRLGAALLTCTASVARLSSPLTEPCLVRMKSLFRHAIRMGTKTKMMRT